MIQALRLSVQHWGWTEGTSSLNKPVVFLDRCPTFETHACAMRTCTNTTFATFLSSIAACQKFDQDCVLLILYYTILANWQYMESVLLKFKSFLALNQHRHTHKKQSPSNIEFKFSAHCLECQSLKCMCVCDAKCTPRIYLLVFKK